MAPSETNLPKQNHLFEKQQHRAYAMKTRNGNNVLISLLAYRLIHIVLLHHGATTTMAFNPSQAMVLSRRRYSSGICIGPKIRTQSRFQSPRSVGIFPWAGYFYASTCRFSTFNSSNKPPPSENAPAKTQYTIDDSICLPTKKVTLEKAVHKACRSLDVYMEKKPAAAHTRRAFEILVEMIDEDGKESSNSYEGIVLDSGCGTGRSTKLLASSSMFPRHLVIGVDRSLARLTKTKDNRPAYENSSAGNDGDDDDDNGNDGENSTSDRDAYCHKVSDNAFLVRAELVDFWRCCIERGWTTPTELECDSGDSGNEELVSSNSSNRLKITHHYMLYPNPYPTNARLSSRWYAHPSFPLILKLGVPTMVIRSNWEGYLNEFAQSVEMANEFYKKSESSTTSTSSTENNLYNLALPYMESAKQGPSERIDKSVALTNFESKYDNVGERTFELVLERRIV